MDLDIDLGSYLLLPDGPGQDTASSSGNPHHPGPALPAEEFCLSCSKSFPSCLPLFLPSPCAPAWGYYFMAQSLILNLLSTYCMPGLIHTEIDQVISIFKELAACQYLLYCVEVWAPR